MTNSKRTLISSTRQFGAELSEFLQTANPTVTTPGWANPNLAAVGVSKCFASWNEAWFWWKLSDNTSLRSGRQSMDYGDGLVFSKNDWLGTPYNVDGIMARMSWDFHGS